ncbi:protein cordon-bleu [Fukomys damarensis]|uniref:protein cordon-bleu n=1 Tax=Fukomys damarensis TaxID=885580 RepID=UPI001454EED1|nr:protein cordon-bleu [Fukomys damarensis]
MLDAEGYGAQVWHEVLLPLPLPAGLCNASELTWGSDETPKPALLVSGDPTGKQVLMPNMCTAGFSRAGVVEPTPCPKRTIELPKAPSFLHKHVANVGVSQKPSVCQIHAGSLARLPGGSGEQGTGPSLAAVLVVEGDPVSERRRHRWRYGAYLGLCSAAAQALEQERSETGNPSALLFLLPRVHGTCGSSGLFWLTVSEASVQGRSTWQRACRKDTWSVVPGSRAQGRSREEGATGRIQSPGSAPSSQTAIPESHSVRNPCLRRKMKARAPPPPGKPALLRDPTDLMPPCDMALGYPQNLIHQQEALRDSTVDVTVVLPSGLEKHSVVRGSHAMMDLLVELCLQNHLNPSHYALEIRSSETQQPLSFKPNTLVGTLNVHTVFLKEKVPEEKVKPSPRKEPEKSMRLVVNYLRTQKAVVRVSPSAPLRSVLPLICAKCDVSPEHVVLLRDSAAGEELELSKSLSELGVKELYAWDNRRETFRKSSLSNDETDKEKKKFLGFFKVNKRSSSKGCLTTPNSPSEHPRSLSLGPSLSLGNVSGVSVKSEMKKRQAPPPPSGAGPLVQDKTPEKVSLGSQVDLQRKKRRAPAPPPPQPPPPSPLVPSRREDKEENRKSTIGAGRQVPQKPPRGSTRGPPHLVLPPPPSYPPDPEELEPLGPPGESAGSEPSELRPKLSLPRSPGSHSSVNGVLPEAEETVSVGSCFASEDTTEDSGVVSSPSDIVSLDSQHDGLKPREKWATDQEDCSDLEPAGTPEPGHQKSPSWEGPGPGKSCPRSKEGAITVEDELLITGRLHCTLAEPDGSLDEMEDSYDTDSSSATGSLTSVWGHRVRDTVPVTFIGEVSDDPLDWGLSSNRNNNAGSSDMGSVAHRGPCLPKGESAGPAGGRWSPPDVGPGAQVGSQPGATPKAAKLPARAPGLTEPGPHLPPTERTEAPPRVEQGSDPGPQSWSRLGQPAAGSLGRKPGLTTYRIVPARPETRCYDRGAALSTGGLEIDELGNLVSARGACAAHSPASPTSPGVDAQTQPLGKVKEFWRRGENEMARSPPAGLPAAGGTPTLAHAPTPGGLLATGPTWAATREPPSCPQVPTAHSHVPQPGQAQAVREADGSTPPSLFGPKKKFRPVVQKPAPKDTSLHSALMEAIHTAGSKDKLRKTAEPPEERRSLTPSYTEADSARSALLAAIRGHSGARSLRKVLSSASEELRGCPDIVPPQAPRPPLAPQAPSAPMTAPGLSSRPLGNAVDAQQALLDAIRSGSGAARLRKVPLIV